MLGVSYYGQALELTLPKEADNDFGFGHVLLTKAGEELARVCGSGPIDGFFDYVYERWSNASYVPKKDAERDAASVAGGVAKQPSKHPPAT